MVFIGRQEPSLQPIIGDRMSKRWIYILPFIIALVFLFQNWFFSTALEYSFVNNLEDVFKARVTYSKVEKKGSTVLFYDLRMEQSDKPIFKADKIQLDYDIEWLKRAVNLNFKVDHPVLKLPLSDLDLWRALKDKQNFIKFNLSGTVSKGEIENGDHILPFQLTTEPLLKIDLNGSQFVYKDDILESHFNEFSLSDVSVILKSLTPSLFSSKMEGFVTGDLAIQIREGLAPEVEGKAAIRKFKFEKDYTYTAIDFIQANLSRSSEESYYPPFKGEITFKGGQIVSHHNGTLFELKDLGGVLSSSGNDDLALNFTGVEALDGDHNLLKGDIKAEFNGSEKVSVIGILTGKSARRGDSELKIKASNLGAPFSVTTLELKNFGLFEYALFDKIVSKLNLKIPLIDFKGGLIDGTFKISTVDHKPSEISAENLSVRNLKVHFKEWDLSAYAQTVAGFFKMNLNHETPRETAEGELLIVNGDLKFYSLAPTLSHFSNIQTKIKIVDGRVQKSIASVSLAGLKGSAEIDWLTPNELMRIKLEGTGQDIAQMMPKRVEAGILRHLANEKILVDAVIREEIEALRLKGEMRALNSFNQLDQLFEFGFDLKKGETPLTDPLEQNFWDEISSSLYNETLPPSLLGMGYALENVLVNESGIEGLTIKNGWFQASHMNLEHFVSPFLFPKDDLILKGIGDLNGQFDLGGLKLKYKAQDLVLENPHLKMEMAQTIQDGEHWVDFKTKSHLGHLKLKEATYFDKKKGLFFQNIDGDVTFWDKQIFIDPISAVSNHIEMAGQFVIDYSDPGEGVFDLAIHANSLVGKYKDAAELLGHIDPNLFLAEIPLDGSLQLKEEGATLMFHVVPHDYEWDAKISGIITEGTLKGDPHDFSGYDISLEFNYDKEAKTLYFNDFSGLLLIGEKDREEEYTFEAERFGFDDFGNLIGFFDFKLSDLKGEVGRLKGTLKKEGELTKIEFDKPSCHFGNLECEKIDLTLKELKGIDQFRMETRFRLSTLVHEMSRFSRTGLLFIPSSLFQRIGDLNSLSGDVAIKLDYQGDFSQFNFSVSGENLTIDNRTIKELNIKGEKKGNLWTINDAKADDLNISLDLLKEPGKWKVNHIGVRKGQLLLAGLKGEWDENNPVLEADIPLFELNLAALSELPEAETLVKQYTPQGTFKGSGKVRWDPNLLSLKVSGKAEGLLLKGIPFHNDESFEVTWIPKQEWSLSNLKLSPYNPGNTLEKAELVFEKGRFDSVTSQVDVFPLRFNVEASSLPWFIQFVKNWGDLAWSDGTVKTLSEVKSNGSLAGTLLLNQKEGAETIVVSVAEGYYHFDGQPYYLKNAQVEITPDEIKGITQLLKEKSLLWVLLRTAAPDYNRGIVVISDGSYEEKEPINIVWNTHNGYVVLEEVKGSAEGLSFNLREGHSDESTLHMVGEIGIDCERAKNLLKPEHYEKMARFEVGSGYALVGGIAFPRSGDGYAFDGEIHGYDFQFKGYQFNHMHATLKADENIALLKNLEVMDEAGRIYIPEVRIDQTGLGSIYIPKIESTDLRPSLLYDVGKGRPQETKPLIVRSFVVNDINGQLSDLKTLKGKGQLFFQNPVKKNLHNTIFKIPAEILSRIGIDLIALTPVSGNVIFEIRDEHIFLTKFKDVYSDGKLSKFYLADTPSKIDFNGKLNLNVKMKQYTLLFKLAELFTFHIEGTLAKPTYSLRKQGKEEIHIDES